MSVPEERSSRLDVCRFLCIALIVFNHNAEPHVYGQAFQSGINEFLMQFVSVLTAAAGTAALSMMSGYLLFGTYRDRTFARTMRTKLRTILAPAVIWAAIFVFIAFLFQYFRLTEPRMFQLYPPDVADILDGIFGWRLGPINYPLFFLYDLMTCFVFAPAFYLIYRWAPWHAIAVFLVAAVLDYGILPGVRSDIALYFLIGGFLAYRNVDPSAADRGRWLWISLFLAACTAYAAIVFTVGFSNDQGYLGGLNAVRMFGPLAVWSVAGMLMGTAAGRLFVTLAPASFFIFCSHYTLMHLAARAYYARIADSLDLTFWPFFVLNGLLSIAVCLAAVYALQAAAPRLLRLLSGGRLGAGGRTLPGPSLNWPSRLRRTAAASAEPAGASRCLAEAGSRVVDLRDRGV